MTSTKSNAISSTDLRPILVQAVIVMKQLVDEHGKPRADAYGEEIPAELRLHGAPDSILAVSTNAAIRAFRKTNDYSLVQDQAVSEVKYAAWEPTAIYSVTDNDPTVTAS
ncbi:MAG: hypothetical protein GY838_13525 [bacterium]|nr:hypothetical protein [bacterium]